MFVSTPESTTWIAQAKSWVRLKHLSGGIGLDEDLSILDRIPLRNIDLEMDMVFSEAEFDELKTKTFQVSKRLNAGVYVALFSKISVSIMGEKHHRHPVVSCVSRWLFIATAIYIFHTTFSPIAPSIEQAKCLPRATKK